jgi:hypothetical protein
MVALMGNHQFNITVGTRFAITRVFAKNLQGLIFDQSESNMETGMSESLRGKIGSILAMMGLCLFLASAGILLVPVLASLFVVLLLLDGGLILLGLGAVVVAEVRDRFDF